jgi:hypothetical protein
MAPDVRIGLYARVWAVRSGQSRRLTVGVPRETAVFHPSKNADQGSGLLSPARAVNEEAPGIVDTDPRGLGSDGYLQVLNVLRTPFTLFNTSARRVLCSD